MKLLMLCREPRLYSCQRLKLAAEQRGYQLDILDPNRFILQLKQGKLRCYYQEKEATNGKSSLLEQVTEYVGVIPRFGATSTEMGCKVLAHFEWQSIPVLNTSESFRLARDKWQSLQKLVSKGLPVPDTMFAGELCRAFNVVKHFSSPFIIKTLSGAQGVGVMLSESPSSAESLLETLNIANIKSITQQFITESKGQDIRAFVIGKQVVAAMRRSSVSGDFRANIHQGGMAQPVALSAEEQQIAIDATQALGLDVAGVDLIRSHNGIMILEVNASPGLEMIEKVSQVDIVSLMIQQLLAKK